MSWDSAFGQLKQELPRFNNYLLKEHAKEQINQCADFIGEVFKQAASMMEGNVLRYVAYKYLTPVETLEACVKDEYVSGKWDIQKSVLPPFASIPVLQKSSTRNKSLLAAFSLSIILFMVLKSRFYGKDTYFYP